MKKFFYSTLAVLALVGCGKIETPSVDFVDNNKPAEIGFSSQATFGTKAVVSGTALPSDAKFSVFADFKEDGTLSEANYLYNAEYGSDGQPTGTDKYYWPVSDKTVTLDFYAIYPSATDYGFFVTFGAAKLPLKRPISSQGGLFLPVHTSVS